MNVKSVLGACLSLSLAVVLGYATFVLLQVGPSGRDIFAIALPAAVVLFFSGLVYGRWLMGNWLSCMFGVALYGVAVCLGVMYFSGPTFPFFILEWAATVLVLTVPPWGLGLVLGRWARRFTLTG